MFFEANVLRDIVIFIVSLDPHRGLKIQGLVVGKGLKGEFKGNKSKENLILLYKIILKFLSFIYLFFKLVCGFVDDFTSSKLKKILQEQGKLICVEVRVQVDVS